MFKNILSTLLLLLFIGGIGYGLFYFFIKDSDSGVMYNNAEYDKVTARKKMAESYYNITREGYPNDDYQQNIDKAMEVGYHKNSDERDEVPISSDRLGKGQVTLEDDIFAQAYKQKYFTKADYRGDEIVYDMDTGKYKFDKNDYYIDNIKPFYENPKARLDPEYYNEYAYVVVQKTIFGDIPIVYGNTPRGGLIFDPPLNPRQNTGGKSGIDFGIDKGETQVFTPIIERN